MQSRSAPGKVDLLRWWVGRDSEQLRPAAFAAFGYIPVMV
jgi:hypothetical protein